MGIMIMLLPYSRGMVSTKPIIDRSHSRFAPEAHNFNRIIRKKVYLIREKCQGW